MIYQKQQVDWQDKRLQRQQYEDEGTWLQHHGIKDWMDLGKPVVQNNERVDKFIVKSITLPTNCRKYATVSIRGIISVHTAPRNKSPRTVAEHQLRLVIKKQSKYKYIQRLMIESL